MYRKLARRADEDSNRTITLVSSPLGRSFGLKRRGCHDGRDEPLSSQRCTVAVPVLALSLVAIAWTAAGQQVKQPPPGSAARQRFLGMFARTYCPGRTGQLLIVPREGDFITRADPNVASMHGSPWSYDVSIHLMFAGPERKNRSVLGPASQQDVAPTLAASLGVQMPATATGRVLPVLRTGFARPRAVMLIVLDGMRRD
jgi:hypothetical protein